MFGDSEPWASEGVLKSEEEKKEKRFEHISNISVAKSFAPKDVKDYGEKIDLTDNQKPAKIWIG